jgi:hypothetical protein
MYLDAKGLVAVWREGLLAQAVLRGRTRGYRQHPQLARFRAHPRPTVAIALYLARILEEAQARGYRFDTGKIGRWAPCDRIEETTGQLAYEWEHLKRKLRRRDGAKFREALAVRRPHAHPLFVVVRGGVREWERVGRGQTGVGALPKTARRTTARPSRRPSRRSPS